MLERQQHAPRCVYILADILDSMLAACEDLLHLEQAEPPALLRLELAAITHVLQARRCIQDIDLGEPELVDQCVLFLTGTAALDLEQLRDGRSSPRATIEALPSEDYLIGGRVPIGVLAETAATLLDRFEEHFVLYDADQPAPVRSSRTSVVAEAG